MRIDHHDPDAPPTRGPLDAPVTIELFVVPVTQSKNALYRNLEQLQARHPSRIRLVYRLLKSNQTNLPDAVLEALAQGKFFEMIAALDDSRLQLSREHIIEIGRAVGLDTQRLESAMVEGRYADILRANDERHSRLHGVASPDALFNGVRPRGSLGSLSPAALEDLYLDAYSRAVDLVDRGMSPEQLPAVFEADAMASAPPSVSPGAAIEDDPEHAAGDVAHLADPPIPLDGLPAKGPRDAAVPILVLCQPASLNCYRQLQMASNVASIYPADVRVVWAPWFDAGRKDAQRLTLLADASLCAESLGDGWDWIDQMFGELARRHGRVPLERTMDTVA